MVALFLQKSVVATKDVELGTTGETSYLGHIDYLLGPS